MTRLPLRVAVLGTNDPRNVSGGRYHGLILACAVAAVGGEAHVVTDHMPSFAPDLEPLAPGGVRFHITADFATGLPQGRFDWVIIVPAGVFLPNFYENCLDFAAAAAARVALINFESANWYNEVSPAPRDPRLWDYWRRVCLHGGLILSSARISDRYPRAFYRSEQSRLRFEVWSPPINSVAARRFEGLPKDGSLLAFVRPKDAHKGSTRLTEIDPALFAGRTLQLVSGLDAPPEFEAAIAAHLSHARGARLEILTRIPDLQKFRLLTAAQAVLFPSRFEGFGYPPIEAAYVGTESVCFPLPVLVETVGRIANFADGDSMAAFGGALARALAAPERREALRAEVRPIADFHVAALNLADILLRSADVVEPRSARAWRVALGPWAGASARSSAEVARDVSSPPLPAYVRAARRATSGEVLISAVVHLPPGFDRIDAAVAPGGAALPLTWSAAAPTGDFAQVDIHLIAPPDSLSRRIEVQAMRDGARWGDPILMQPDRIASASAKQPALCGVSENVVQGERRLIRGWVLASEPLTELRYSNYPRL